MTDPERTMPISIKDPKADRPRRLADELDEIAERCGALRLWDARAPNEILGFDEHGSPR